MPAWSPSQTRDHLTHVETFESWLKDSGRLQSDNDLYEWSVNDLDGFWSSVWDYYSIIGDKGSVAYRDSTLPNADFFPEARLNFAENLLREWPNETPIRVVASGEQGRGSEILCELTREELIARVAQFASVLRTRGISAGDRDSRHRQWPSGERSGGTGKSGKPSRDCGTQPDQAVRDSASAVRCAPE